MNLKNKSWKTSGAGAAVLLAALSTLLTSLTDNNPATNPDWNVFFAQAAAALGLLFARDNNKSSEQVGASKAAEATET